MRCPLPLPVLLLCAAVSAQSTSIATVSIRNTTTMAGRTIADVVIPLRRGARKTVPMLISDRKRLCDVEAMGAGWPDGSLRYLRVDLPVEVSGSETRVVRLFEHKGSAPVFRQHPAVTKALPNLKMWFRAAGQRIGFGKPVLVENGKRVRVYRAGVRCANSCMWARLHVLVMHDAPNPRFYFEWGNSNPKRSELHENPGPVSIEVQGAKVVLDEAGSKLHDKYDIKNGGTGLLLHTGGWLADGQAQCFEGRLLLSGGAPRVRALAYGWHQTGAFGPFGDLLPEAGVDRKWWQRHIIHDDNAQARQPWATPAHGCHSNPSNTGDQPDFGTIVMRPDLLLADPSRLRAIARSVFQEWGRPTHFREFDLSLVTVKNHPKLLTLSGRPHWPAGPGIDVLGKKADYLDDGKIAADERDQTYRGHDSEHLSINYLCALALTTGDRMARQECRHHAELWLAEFRTSSGTGNDKPGVSRAIGRSLMAGCWLWLVTGRDDLARRVQARAKGVTSALTKQRTGAAAALPFVLTPRWDESRGHYWPPWEESIAAVGLAAVHALFGTKEAAVLAQLVSENVVLHGIGIGRDGWRVGYKVPLRTDAGRPYVALLDPEFRTMQAAGAGITRWTVPAILYAARYSKDAVVRALSQRMFRDLMAETDFVDERFLEWIPVVPRYLGL